jgi:hypothetical protein
MTGRYPAHDVEARHYRAFQRLMVVTSDRLEMTGGTSALKSPIRLTSYGPGMLIGLWPELQRE